MALASHVDEIRYLVRSRLDCQGEGENGTEPASAQPDRRDVRILGGGTDAGRQPAQPTGNVGTPGQRFGLLADAVADHLHSQGQSFGHPPMAPSSSALIDSTCFSPSVSRMPVSAITQAVTLRRQACSSRAGSRIGKVAAKRTSDIANTTFSIVALVPSPGPPLLSSALVSNCPIVSKMETIAPTMPPRVE